MSRRERQRRRARNRGGAARPAFLTLGVFFTLLILGVLGAVGWVVATASSAPSLATLKPVNPGATSVVYAKDGSRLGFIQSDVLRTPVPLSAIPKSVGQSTVAVEDRRFFQHQGVDFEGVVRAAMKNLESGETVQGGSTLTMQLVKNLYSTDRKRTFTRKIREAKLAEELENQHKGRKGKLWILNRYVNSVPYGTVGGQTAVGIQAASRVFFNKPAKELKVHESALLAGLPQAPSEYNPFDQPEAAIKRRNDVLRRMAEQGYITRATAAKASARGLGVEHSRYYTERREGYFFDYMKSELIKKYGVDRVRRGGLKINTTVDLELQRKARAAISSQISGNIGEPASAIVAIDARNGYIRAMASSARYGDSKFNLAAQGKRQPGSTFKTMVLMAALRRGIDPDRTSYVSKRLNFNDPTWGKIDVSTYSNSYSGRQNITSATLKSDNSVYMQLDLDVGPEAVRKTARDMGIRSPLDALPSEGLGGLRIGVSPLEMANAYATIASGGWRYKPIAITKVTFPDGHSENLGRIRRHKAFSDGVTAKATEILRKNITGGTGGNANIGCPVAGKTGTTDNFVDAWFVGYTPRLAAAVWIGHPKERISMPGMAGGTKPALIFGNYMRSVKGGYCGDFPQPKEPFESAPFFGKYATTGAPGSATEGYQSQSRAQDFETGQKPPASTGGTGYDEDLYESKPQPAPETKPAPATPAPAPTPEPATPAQPTQKPTTGGANAPGRR